MTDNSSPPSSVKECSCANFFFFNTEPWRLYSPQYTEARGWNIVYLIWKWIAAIYFLVFAPLSYIYPLEYSADNKAKWFIFYTNWTYIVYLLSLLVSATSTSVKFASTDSLKDRDTGEDVPWYLKLNWCLYNISSANVIVVNIVYWLMFFVASDDTVLWFYTTTTHGVNAVTLLIDLFITAMPMKILHFYLPTLLLFMWGLFSVAYDFLEGTNQQYQPYIYSVIDWSENEALASYLLVGAVILVVVIHFILVGLSRLREKIYDLNCCCRFHSSEVDVA